MHYHIRRGMKTSFGPKPEGAPVDMPAVNTIAMLGDDYPNVVFDLHVKECDAVRAGQTLCVDRHHPDIHFVANACGRVSNIKLGPRRKLALLEIAVEGDDVITFAEYDIRKLLLKAGAWSSFRTRPFGLIPDPATSPAAIFVTATKVSLQAPDPRNVIAAETASFQRGAEALLHLTSGPTYVCQRQGKPLVTPNDRLKIATFSGPDASGFAGPQIHRLMPASRRRMVWEIGYQDVVAIGHLLETGQVMTSRIVALSGPSQTHAETVSVPIGAKIADVLKGMAAYDAQSALSGSLMTGQQVQYLRRKELQITVLDKGAKPRSFWRHLLDALPAAPIGATQPMEAFERVFPFDILPTPLMRALAVGDIETAERLGCLELLEEDMAPLSSLCPSGSDYSQLLRHTFNLILDERVG